MKFKIKRSLFDKWKAVFCNNFPQEESKKDPSLMVDYGTDKAYSEPVIDALKERKMRDLDVLRESMRKQREQENESLNIQIIS